MSNHIVSQMPVRSATTMYDILKSWSLATIVDDGLLKLYSADDNEDVCILLMTYVKDVTMKAFVK